MRRVSTPTSSRCSRASPHRPTAEAPRLPRDRGAARRGRRTSRRPGPRSSDASGLRGGPLRRARRCARLRWSPRRARRSGARARVRRCQRWRRRPRRGTPVGYPTGTPLVVDAGGGSVTQGASRAGAGASTAAPIRCPCRRSGRTARRGRTWCSGTPRRASSSHLPRPAVRRRPTPSLSCRRSRSRDARGAWSRRGTTSTSPRRHRSSGRRAGPVEGADTWVGCRGGRRGCATVERTSTRPAAPGHWGHEPTPIVAARAPTEIV